MLTPHLLGLAAAIALAFVAPAWGQPEQPMSAGLVNQLQDFELQEQLIAVGVLDGTAVRRPGAIYARPWNGSAGRTNPSGAWNR